MAQEFTFTVNGVERTTTQNKPLLRYLRDDLHIHSAKDGCSEGACGTCTIHVDGAAVKACVLTTALAAGRNIVTVEGLPEDVREAFVYAFGAVGAVQCGFCIPGMVMAGAALIAEDPEPTEEQIKYAIRGNVCRCTGYKKIIEGISLAAAVLRGEKQIDEDLERGDDYGVGKRAFRIDVRKKVLGEGKYPDDIDELDQPGLTYASAVRSKYPRARVLSIDTSKAEALPGVVGILRAEDVPVNQVGHLIQDWDVMIAQGDITRCVGDAIVLVVAEDEATLEKAKKLVKIDYEPLEPVRNIVEAKAADAPRLHDSFFCLWQHGGAQGQRMPEPSRDAWRRRQGAGGERVYRDAALYYALYRACLLGARVCRRLPVQERRQGAVDRPGCLRYAQRVRPYVWLG